MKKLINSNKNIKGFTLIEILLYLGILTIVSVSVLQIFTSILDNKSETEMASDVFIDGRYIIDKLRYDSLRANKIVSPSNLAQSTASAQFKIGSIDYTYSLQDGNLILKNFSTLSEDQLNSVNTTVSDLSFLKRSDTSGKTTDTLTITFSLTSKSEKRGYKKTETFNITIGTRPKS